MNKNMSNTDRGVRILLAIVFLALYFTGTITGTIGIVLAIAALIFSLTSAISFCPLYALLGINTCAIKEN